MILVQLSVLYSLKPHQSNLGCFVCQQTVKEHDLPSLLHRLFVITANVAIGKAAIATHLFCCKIKEIKNKKIKIKNSKNLAL